MGGDRLCKIESMAGGAWYVNRKETRWGQGDIGMSVGRILAGDKVT